MTQPLRVALPVPKAAEPRKAPSKGDLATAIRELRTARSLSIEALALAADMHITYLSRIEREIRNPSWEKLCSLADALDVPIAELARHAERVARARRASTTSR
jgi:transcriptional regulator with XRE-family HTH domain